MKRHAFVLRLGERPWQWRPFPRRWLRMYQWARDMGGQFDGRCGICGLDFEAVVHRTGRRR